MTAAHLNFRQKSFLFLSGWAQRGGGRHQLENPQGKKAQSQETGAGTTVSGQREKRGQTGKRKCQKLKR